MSLSALAPYRGRGGYSRRDASSRPSSSPIASSESRRSTPAIEAWAHLDPRSCDEAGGGRRPAPSDRARRSGRCTASRSASRISSTPATMPTEFGSPAWAGRTPRRDATAVARLREAGAVIMGKTVTTEYAYFQPGKTRNPHDPSRTPGRLVERLGGRGRRPHGAGRDRLADQRLGDPAGGVLRRGRVQADAWAYFATRRARIVAHARSGRRVRPQRRGCGLAGGSDGRLRRGRSGYAPGRKAAIRIGGRERAAFAAAVCVRSLGCVGAGRAGDARGVRRIDRGAGRGRDGRRSRRELRPARSICSASSWKWRWRTISGATMRNSAIS